MLLIRNKNMKPKDIFIGYPSVFYKVFQHLEFLAYSEIPDYGFIKETILNSFNANFPNKILGNWKPINKFDNEVK